MRKEINYNSFSDMKLIYFLGGLAIALSVHAITQPGSNMVRARTLKETMEQDAITEPTITRENANLCSQMWERGKRWAATSMR